MTAVDLVMVDTSPKLDEVSAAAAVPDSIVELVNVAASIERIVDSVHTTQLVTAAIRGKKSECFAIALRGHELGVPIMQALGGDLFVVDGKVGMAAELMRALVFRAGHSINVDESSITAARLTGTRSDNDSSCTVEFTIDDAARAGLRGTAWSKYPRSMLLARATSELCRMLFPDVLRGVSYTPEEIDSIAPRDVISTVAVEIDWADLGWADQAEHDIQREQVRTVLAEQDDEVRGRLMHQWQLAGYSWPLSRGQLDRWTAAMAAEGVTVEPSPNLGEAAAVGDAEPPRAALGGRGRADDDVLGQIRECGERLELSEQDLADLAGALLGREIPALDRLTKTSSAKLLANLLGQVADLDEVPAS